MPARLDQAPVVRTGATESVYLRLLWLSGYGPGHRLLDGMPAQSALRGRPCPAAIPRRGI